jgi:hypothetical protein
LPFFERISRLNIIMAVKENMWGAFRSSAVRNHHRMPRGFSKRTREPQRSQLVYHPLCGPPAFGGMRGISRYAPDPKEFKQPLDTSVEREIGSGKHIV